MSIEKEDDPKDMDEVTELEDDALKTEGDEEDFEDDDGGETAIAPHDPEKELEELRAASGESESSAALNSPAERTPERGTKSGGGGQGRRVTSAEELLVDEVKQRAAREQTRIRPYLTGKIVFEIDDKKERYLFDWTNETLKTGKTSILESDCTITLSEDNLMKITSGELNPQLAMLSDKVKVAGQLSLAIYVFNLIAPRSFLH